MRRRKEMVFIYTPRCYLRGRNLPRLSRLDTAQALSLARSQSAVALFAKALDDSKIPVRTMSAPLRPLNNITTPAIAIEISPPASRPRRTGLDGISAIDGIFNCNRDVIRTPESGKRTLIT